ncbi:MAG: hypothetical protein IJW84_02715 [Alphaproteobacteria bacterium]|nr:hypothetical protein [Alphaproteobacteria bacterium]
MFDFSIFNRAQWRHLAHAQLRGFPGFVFGILLLAALPLYIATTTLIVRTKQPLITIPLPKIKIPEFLRSSPAPTPETVPESETPTLGPDEVDTPVELPDDMPAELRFAFIRARNNIGRIQTSAFNAPHPQLSHTQPDTPDTIADNLPLPTDFDIDIPAPDVDPTIPTFTEINFDDEIIDTPTTPNDNTELIQHLTQNNKEFSTDEDIVITDTHAIITHADSDFWVTDTDNWFATGRTCPSPIIAVQNTAEKYNRTPAIYLASMNIMDIDKLIPQWQSAGITVITDLSEI